ncbi:MAG: PTS sugar transporter subunit IIB [Elusimicrobiota bacterium]
MAIALVRIDDRLIHGQVVEAWLPHLGAQRVLVVSEGAAADPMQKALMRLALPERIGLDVLGLQDARAALPAAASCAEKVLILAQGPREVLALLEGGAALPTVNVGGMHYAAGRVHLGRAVYLGEEDRTALLEIARRGVRLEGRAVPSEPAEDITALLRSKEK